MTPNLDIKPDIKVSLKQTFGIDSEMEVEAFSKKTGMKGSQFIFTTFMGEMSPDTFVLMTVWPDFEMMGQGFQNFFTEGTGDDTFAKWNESTNCMQRNLLTVENTWTIE